MPANSESVRSIVYTLHALSNSRHSDFGLLTTARKNSRRPQDSAFDEMRSGQRRLRCNISLPIRSLGTRRKTDRARSFVAYGDPDKPGLYVQFMKWHAHNTSREIGETKAKCYYGSPMGVLSFIAAVQAELERHTWDNF